MPDILSHLARIMLGKVRWHWAIARMRSGLLSTARIRAGPCGFFGNMFMTLNGIRLCEWAGVRAEPDWRKDDSLFYEPAHGENAWRYYFEDVPPPPGFDDPGVGGAVASGRVMTFRPAAVSIYPLYPGLGVRRSYAECIRKYVRPRPDVRTEIDRLADQLFGQDHVLGVHMRLTDTTTGVESRTSLGLQRYYDAIDRYSLNYPNCRIFVASDAEPAVEELRNQYPGRVVAIEAIRSTDTTSIHGHYDSGVPGSPYRKGLDVVRDAYLLSRVKYLIRANSRVTMYSLCVNPDLAFEEISLTGQRSTGAESFPDDFPAASS